MNARARILFCLVTMASAAQAAEVKLAGPEIKSVLDNTILSAKDTEQIFQSSGVTFYSVGGNQSQGNWKVADDQFCSQWPPNESWACYDVLRDGQTITFVSKSGQRTDMSMGK
jgi:outer membrane protease